MDGGEKTKDIKMPDEYTLATNEEGNAILPRDFLPTMSVSKLTDDWASMTVQYRPYFSTNKVRGTVLDDSLGRNTAENRKQWIKEIQNEIFGNKFKDWMKHGWNIGLTKLMNIPATLADA